MTERMLFVLKSGGDGEDNPGGPLKGAEEEGSWDKAGETQGGGTPGRGGRNPGEVEEPNQGWKPTRDRDSQITDVCCDCSWTVGREHGLTTR
jgi:hypothetical protein